MQHLTDRCDYALTYNYPYRSPFPQARHLAHPHKGGPSLTRWLSNSRDPTDALSRMDPKRKVAALRTSPLRPQQTAA
jgi:hypothetical protein